MSSQFFGPLKVGNIALQHRVVLAPLTRFKATAAEHVPYLLADYYAQRASRPGTLLTTEATFIAARAAGYNYIPGIAHQGLDPSFPHISASDVQRPGYKSPPRPLTVPEITEYVGLYAQAAKNAIEARFDGVEIDAANGYLPDQFLQAVTNTRTDGYGGSTANRARFTNSRSLTPWLPPSVQKLNGLTNAGRKEPIKCHKSRSDLSP
ncbi:hypothetical protein B0H17DRAFT_1216938 [Mycena rosella]|uniref:NADH:flavin oxidoreductase/NADH oxidase N-terminal domain-containing protein n=1 Tax=Mycena rosella TaxID=1033263 RepID=A0AAD7C379_MYCRO|nr:hypothetical protein B0H17DRAFT_1216938 [Mycena rosella]